ncbi:MAG: efflux RND transporter periplasmic adaptor subunit [Anaerotignum sp.]|nr:efflux RND transporter periplasmic adaptor subunit [Anaerotignum sp.]
MNKNMFKIVLMVLLSVAIIFFAGGLFKKDESENKIVGRPVKTMKIESSIHERTLNYTGTIGEDNLTKLSFQSAGKIEKILVKDSEKVAKGQILATIDVTAIKLKEKEALEQLSMLDIQLELNQKDYDFIFSNYEKNKALYEIGALSKISLDEMELKLDKAKLALEATKKQKNQLAVQYDSIEKQIEDGAITAVEDGYVVRVLVKEGENVSPSAPAIIQRGEKQIINVGVSQEDIPNIKMDQKAFVKLNNELKEGTIVNIQKTPDMNTKLYMIDIEMQDDFSQEAFLVGGVTEVSITLGNETGMWIPVKCIQNDGEDYVYVVENSRAFKKMIEIQDFDENNVLVKGLSEEDLLVISGMSNIKEGYLVNVEEQVE